MFTAWCCRRTTRPRSGSAAALERAGAYKLKDPAVAGRVLSSSYSVACCFSERRELPRSFCRAGHLQGVGRYQPPRVRVHRQHGVFEGHGAQQVLFAVLSEGHRCGELLPLQPDHGPAPGPFHAAAVGELGSVGALHRDAQPFQQVSGRLGERGPGIRQHLHCFEALAAWVGYLDYYLESSHSCPLHLREIHGRVVGEPAVPGPEGLGLRGLGVPHYAEPVGGWLGVHDPAVPYPELPGGIWEVEELGGEFWQSGVVSP